MRHATLRSLLLLVFAISTAAAHAEQACGILPPAEVDRAFAEFAPWRAEVGGAVGHCVFLSNARAAPNSLSFMQQFKASKTDADQVFDAMRQGLAASNYAITNVAGFGERAFRYSPTGGKPDDHRSTSITAQKGKLVVTVMLNLQRAVTDADISAAIQLGQFALRGADDPELARKASTCPWFDESALKKLFGGKPYEVQVHGENSCMAADRQKPKRVLLASALKLSGGLSLDVLSDPGCSRRALPELGKNAALSFDCKGGNPRASVIQAANGFAITLTWVPGAEPGDADKAALVELAKSVAR